MNISRRDFLASSGAAVGALMAANAGISLLEAGEVFQFEKGIIPDRWEKGVCRYCGTGCGVECGLKGDKLVAIRGNEEYPVNKGSLCLKGLSLMYTVHSDERATKPLIKNGDQYKEVSWDEGLNATATKIKEIVEKHGPDSVALYVGAQIFTEEMFVGNKLFKGLIGTNNVEANARLCMASAVTGYLTSFGSDEPMGGYEDIEHTDCIFIIGSNLAENHPVIFSRILKERAKRDIKLIVADPRYTPTAAHADVWLPFLPGTDMTLLNGMANIIFKEGYADLDFIKNHTKFIEGGKIWGKEKELTIEEYKAFLSEYTPEMVSEKCDIEKTKFLEAAHLFGKSEKVLSMWTMGLNHRSWGTWVNNQVHNLHLITGNLCKLGASSLSMTGQPNACGGVREQGMLAHILPGHRSVKNEKHRKEMEKIWQIPEGSISSKPGSHTVKMFDELGDKIKLIWIICSNPAQTLPDLEHFFPKLEKAFVIVQDIFPPTQTQPKKFKNVTAEFADIFLPSSFWIEKGGVFGNTERRSSLTERMITPPKDLKSDSEIIMEVGRRMGYEEHFNYPTTESIWNEYILSTKGTDLDLSPATYSYLRKEGSVQWPIVKAEEKGSDIRYIYPQDRYLKSLIESGKVKKPDDNIYFYGMPDGKAKIFKRPHRDPAEIPDKEYPFYLTTGRVVHHWHTGTMTMRVPWLKKMVPDAFVELNQVDAKKLGIANGDNVELETRRGKLKLVAKVVDLKNGKLESIEERVSIPRPGVFFIPFFDANKLANILTVNAFDGLSKEPEYKICAVKIRKVGA